MLTKVIAITSYVGVASLFCMAIVTGVDVIGRYAFNIPVRGSVDLIELLMGILFACGIATTTASDNHISVDTVFQKLPPLGQHILRIFAGCVCTFIFFILVWQTFEVGIVEMKSGKGTFTLDIPFFPFKFILAIGFMVSMIFSIRQVILFLRIKKG